MGRALVHAVAAERYRVLARALGAPPDAAAEIWRQTVADAREWPWSFDVAQDATRRLVRRYAELREPPPDAFRVAARNLLRNQSDPFTPADVDRLADEIVELNNRLEEDKRNGVWGGC